MQTHLSQKGLTTAFEAVKVLFQNLFCNFGLSEDIVSDCGPQLIYCV